MKFLVLAALPALVAAQAYGPPQSDPSSSAASSSAAPTPTAGPGQHLIQLAPGGAFTFSPSTVTAAENETVIFVFPTSGGFQHSVSQSNFTNPCELAPGGFDSGLQVNGATFSITITNASLPIWFFCQQTSPLKHCNMGMVGGINVPANGTHDIAAFIAEASTASDPAETASGILTGLGAVATAPAGTSAAATSTSSKASSAVQLVASAGSLLAGLFAAVYTLA